MCCDPQVFHGTPLEAQAWKLLVNPTTFVCPFKYKDDEQLNECKDKRHRLGGSSNLHSLINRVPATGPNRRIRALAASPLLKLLCSSQAPELEPLRWKDGHLTKYHKDQAASMLASRLKVVLDEPGLNTDSIDAQGGWLVAAPARHKNSNSQPW